jgi:hypothetical protein
MEAYQVILGGLYAVPKQKILTLWLATSFNLKAQSTLMKEQNIPEF